MFPAILKFLGRLFTAVDLAVEVAQQSARTCQACEGVLVLVASLLLTASLPGQNNLIDPRCQPNMPPRQNRSCCSHSRNSRTCGSLFRHRSGQIVDGFPCRLSRHLRPFGEVFLLLDPSSRVKALDDHMEHDRSTKLVISSGCESMQASLC